MLLLHNQVSTDYKMIQTMYYVQFTYNAGGCRPGLPPHISTTTTLLQSRAAHIVQARRCSWQFCFSSVDPEVFVFRIADFPGRLIRRFGTDYPSNRPLPTTLNPVEDPSIPLFLMPRFHLLRNQPVCALCSPNHSPFFGCKDQIYLGTPRHF